jgi:4-hydroxy-4-methyl-2-oxoglutarate aldolase
VNGMLKRLSTLTTPNLADSCLATGVPIRSAPVGMRPLLPTMTCAGPVRPVRHAGSIDVFLEVLERSRPGEVLVIDNAGRLDEACIGDIVLLEAQAAGIAGMVIWGLHRDSRELTEIGFPVFSLGAVPTGPQRVSARPPDVFERAIVGPHAVTAGDIVVGDQNGVLFLPADRLAEVIDTAEGYRDKEAIQLNAMREGQTYRSQVNFSGFLNRREREPSYDFRQHLKELAAAGEV